MNVCSDLERFRGISFKVAPNRAGGGAIIRGSMFGAPNSVIGGALLRFAQLGFGTILRKEFPDIPPHDLITGRAQMNMIVYKEV